MLKGKVTAIRMLPVDSANSFTVNANIVCVDEAGVEYTFGATYMVSDLKPYSDKQTLAYRDWCQAVQSLDSWRLIDWHLIDLVPDYRAGLTPQQTYEKL